MSYLGDPDLKETWRVGCDGCGEVVDRAEAPRSWKTEADRIPMLHFCPKCKAARQRKGGR